MTTKKGFFGFLKRWTSPEETVYASEEQLQRNHAAQARADIDEDYGTQSASFLSAADDSIEFVPVPDDAIHYCCKALEELLSLAGLGGTVSLSRQESNKLFFDITNSTDVGRIIGKDGMTLEALQTLVRAFLFKKYNLTPRVYLDIEGYRQKREDTLRSQALRAAKSVITKVRKMDLKPMNPEERRFIHSMFQNHKSIRSYSVGTGTYRHIVLERRNGVPRTGESV